METLLKFLPEALRERAVVAGGYAAEPALAGDIDLWVLAGRKVDSSRFGWLRPDAAQEADVDDILSWLDEQEIPYELPSGEAHYAGRRLVATVENAYEGKTLQILVTDYATAQALVDSFDISTHMLAKRVERGVMQVTFGMGWTGLREQPQVVRFTTPEATLERLEKICARYGTSPRRADVVKLRTEAARLAEAA